MKKTILVNFCLLLAISSHAQQSIQKFFGTQHPQAQKAFYKTAVSNLPQQTLSYHWTNFNTEWGALDSIITDYNTKGLVASFTSFNTRGRTEYQAFYTYDVNDHPSSSIWLNRNVNSSTWDTVSRSVIFYDQYENETEVINYSYAGASGWALEGSEKSIYTYDTSHLPVAIEYETWENQTCIYKHIDLYDYDSSGVIKTVTSKTWNTSLNVYENSDKVSDISWYKWLGSNVKGSLISSAKKWQWDGSAYLLTSRFSDQYDPMGNFIEHTEEALTGATWRISDRYNNIRTYNNDSAITELVIQQWNGSAMQNSLKYVYSNFILYNGLQHLNKQQIDVTITPNPFTDHTLIRMTTATAETRFKLYDIAGKNVKNASFESGSCRLEKGDLPAGMYFYLVMENDKTITKGKIMIE